MSRRANKRGHIEDAAIVFKPWREDRAAFVPRNRREKRAAREGLSREFRIHVHGKGQWRHKVVKNGELVRP